MRCRRRLPQSTATKLQVAEAEALSPAVAAERGNEAADGLAHRLSSSQTASRDNRLTMVGGGVRAEEVAKCAVAQQLHAQLQRRLLLPQIGLSGLTSMVISLVTASRSSE
jgi:hypothetical protein